MHIDEKEGRKLSLAKMLEEKNTHAGDSGRSPMLATASGDVAHGGRRRGRRLRAGYAAPHRKPATRRKRRRRVALRGRGPSPPSAAVLAEPDETEWRQSLSAQYLHPSTESAGRYEKKESTPVTEANGRTEVRRKTRERRKKLARVGRRTTHNFELHQLCPPRPSQPIPKKFPQVKK